MRFFAGRLSLKINPANRLHRFPGGEAGLPEQIVGMQTASLSKEKQLAIRQWTVSFIAPRQVPRWRASASLAGKLMLFAWK